jgi:hypothetical protein
MTFVTLRNIVLLWICIYFNIADVCSQTAEQQYFTSEGVISLAEGIEIPAIDRGYTIWLPQHDQPKGLIVFFHSRPDTSETDPFIRYATDKGMAVLYATTKNRLEFFFDDASMEEVYEYILANVVKYRIPKSNIMFCGMSLEGTRALRMQMYINGAGTEHLNVKAIAVCDAPLDMNRFYRTCKKAAQLNFHPASANEGRWVSEYLATNLGGSPDSVPSAYTSYSPYTHDDVESNTREFLDVSIRAYTEPDVSWWMENRGKDYYDMNSLDLAAFINQLNLMGNSEAELIVTSDKGYHPDGERHPHSWSIVDEKELIDWFCKLIKDNDEDE